MSVTRKVFGVFFKAPRSIPEEEVLEYAKYVREHHKHWMPSLSEVILNLDGDEVLLEYHFHDVPFERIRRITGYLAEENRWNQAKQAELADRTVHDVR